MAGLHPSEKLNMIQAVKELRELGNTVIVVEHDKEMIRHADHIIEIGPKAGVEGGTVVYQGDYEEYEKVDTLISQYLSGKFLMPERTVRRYTFIKKRLSYLGTCKYPLFKGLNSGISTSCYGWYCWIIWKW